jgi:hypothetical protein
LHNFRTILINRQWVALFESKQIQAQKDGFPQNCAKMQKQIVHTKNPLPKTLRKTSFEHSDQSGSMAEQLPKT